MILLPPELPSSSLPCFLISFPPMIMLPSLSHPPRLSPCHGASIPTRAATHTAKAGGCCTRNGREHQHGGPPAERERGQNRGGAKGQVDRRVREFRGTREWVRWGLSKARKRRGKLLLLLLLLACGSKREVACVHASDISANSSFLRQSRSGERWK